MVLAALVDRWRRAHGTTLALSVSGGQGAGKSTLTRVLSEALDRLGWRTGCLALDDFYLGRRERALLAQRIAPLLATRGVPGTHRISALCNTLDELLREGGTSSWPCFDKALDDTVGMQQGGPFDVVLVEGWCLGALPESAASLQLPCNALERDEDVGGHWRAAIDAQLRNGYALLDQRFHRRLFLAVPDLAAVRRWRGEQERRNTAGRPELALGDAALDRFIAHYQRITERLLEDVASGRRPVDLVWELGADHRIRRWGVTRRGPAADPAVSPR